MARQVESLDMEDKKNKVANYHKNTMEAFKKLLGSMGPENRKDIHKRYITRRLNETETKPYD